MKKILACPDIHFPYEDKKAWKLFLKVIKEIGPDIVVLTGDIIDFYAVSRFPKKKRKYDAQGEIAYTNKQLDKLEAICTEVGVKVYVTLGNHDVRMERYLDKEAPQAAHLFSIAEALHFDERGWEWCDYNESIRIGKINFTHDFGKHGATSLTTGPATYGDNVIYGHTHKLGVFYGGTIAGDTHVCMNTGWLGDVNYIDYAHKDKVRKEDQLGFGYIYLESNGTGHCFPVPILNYRCVVEGRLIK